MYPTKDHELWEQSHLHSPPSLYQLSQEAKIKLSSHPAYMVTMSDPRLLHLKG